MSEYKYKWDNGGKTFVKNEWISIALPQMSQKNGPEASHIHFLIDLWQKHLQTGTIVLSSIEDENFWESLSTSLDLSIKEQQKGKPSIDVYLGCIYCNEIHICEGDGIPSMTISNNICEQATKQCVQSFSRRSLT
jgi:hypothetical protein